MPKWNTNLQIISYALLILALALWGYTIVNWINAEQSFEAWNSLSGAIISTLLFFISFLKSHKPGSEKGNRSMKIEKSNITLHKKLDKYLNDEDLRTLCLYLGVDYDNLDGRGKSAKLRELILFFDRRDRSADLISAITNHYPHITI